jgi:hypothetical protein
LDQTCARSQRCRPIRGKIATDSEELPLDRQVTGASELKVIGAGFGRTGTASIKLALEELGFGPCYHMLEVMKNPNHIDEWSRAARGEAIDWHALFAQYQSSCDWPACAFWDQQVTAFPEANVLLSMRSAEAWYESVVTTIYHARPGNPAFQDLSKLSTEQVASLSHFRSQLQMADAVVWQGTFGGRFDDREYAMSVFNDHVADVKRRVPADKLLVYEVKDGWGPLCSFLGVAAPNRPFPHVNDRASITAMLTQMGLMR